MGLFIFLNPCWWLDSYKCSVSLGRMSFSRSFTKVTATRSGGRNVCWVSVLTYFLGASDFQTEYADVHQGSQINYAVVSQMDSDQLFLFR